jgi:hypothetical protein
MINPEDKTVATISFRARKAIVEKLKERAADLHASIGTAAKYAMEDYFRLLEVLEKQQQKSAKKD